MNPITETLLQAVAGDIEKLLLENKEQIAFSFFKHGEDGVKLSMGINLGQSPKGICASYNMGFDLAPKPMPPDKHKITYKHTIAEDQVDMFADDKE
jgi:hypothetical protein